MTGKDILARLSGNERHLAECLEDATTREILSQEMAEIWYPAVETPLDVLLSSE